MAENITKKNDLRFVQVVPSKRQLDHQKLEFYAFVHFTVNTYTDKEWGDGTESEVVFNPVDFNADQWVDAVKSAGMKGLILTCKHHDGFCLWPSAYTEHSVKNSPWKNGQGDIVRETAEACRKGGIKFGVYLSPWDRNCQLYGQGKPYDDYFINQLTELCTDYGPVFSVWFDGACGEGPNGKKQIYNWDRYYETIRRLQPDACISVCGPDVRWCGNEAGDTRPSEWSVVPKRTQDTEKIKEDSQQSDNIEFRQRKINAQDRDLGSRQILNNEESLVWYAAEVNTSIRPGWFYHTYEDDQVKSLSKLIDIYEKSVGGNATFLLNIPPCPSGLFHQNDVQRLKELGEYLEKTYSNNLIDDAYDVISFTPDENNPVYSKIIRWENPVSVKRIILQEDITKSQRVEHFIISAKQEDGSWLQIYEGTTVGYKKICPVEETVTKELKIVFDDFRVSVILNNLGVY